MISANERVFLYTSTGEEISQKALSMMLFSFPLVLRFICEILPNERLSRSIKRIANNKFSQVKKRRSSNRQCERLNFTSEKYRTDLVFVISVRKFRCFYSLKVSSIDLIFILLSLLRSILFSGRVSTAMIHASDWLPTFYALAGGDVSSLGTIDGFNVWESISNDAQSPRYEILHGLDSLREKKAALRVGDYKMIVHQNRSFYGDWYPRSEALHELDKVPKPKVLKEATVDCTVRHPHPLLYTKAPICNPERKPCLFNIKWDPCEYHNLADFMPNTLKVMVDRLKFYYYKSKPALYPQADESANPNLHGGIWSPWRDKPDIDQTMSDYVYPNSYYDTLKTSFKPQDDHNKPNEFMTGQSSSANGTEQFAPKVASPFHPPSDVQSIIMNAGDFRDRQDAGNDGNAVSAVTPATLATTATRATMASTAEVAITRTPTPPTTATIASTAASFIQLSSAPPAQAVNAVHGNVRPTTFPRTAATSDTEPTANTLATTASPITRAPPVPSIPPAIVEKNKVADVVNYRAQRPSPFRPTGFLKGFFQHQVAGLFKSTSPVSMHKSGGARLVPETVNEVERMVKGRTTARSYPVPFTSTKPVKLPGSFTVPPTAKQAMRNRLFLTKQGSSHVPSDVENVIRQQGFTKHLPSSEVEEISTLPLQPPLVKLTHKPYPHGLKGSIFGTQSNKLNSLPEILDIIDESTVPSAYETGSGQRQIPKIFDIIDETHNLGEKVKEFSSHREGPIATSKPLTSNDVGSGMGVGLNGLPQGISVFGKLGDEKILTKSHDTKGKGREHIVAKEKPQKGKKAPTVHKFIGNITIDGRHFYVVGTESEELESISTQLEGNRITLHLPKGKKTSNRKSKVKNNKSPESADNKSEIGGVAFNTKPSYSEITDYIDEDEDSERPVNKTLAAHNVTAVATAGNNTKCEKVVQLDTSDNAVVVSSVVIVVIASAMVVGVAVVAMVAVVARHCQNARN